MRIRMIRAATILALSLAAEGLGAQTAADLRPFVHRAWGVEDGLPVAWVTNVVQTRDGFVWAATFGGLARFDGVNFELFTAGRAGLPSNRVVDLHAAADGSLFIRTEQGHVARYDDGVFRALGNFGRVAVVRARDLFEDEGGTVWIDSGKDLHFWLDGELRRFDRLPGQRIHAASPAVGGGIWIAADAGLVRWSGETLTRYPWPREAPTSLVDVLEANGIVWVASERGVLGLEDGRWTRGLEGEKDLKIVQLQPHHRPDAVAVNDESLSYELVDGRLLPSPRGPLPVAASARDPSGRLLNAWRGGLRRDGELVWPWTSQINRIFAADDGVIWLASDGLHRLAPPLFETVEAPPELGGVYPVLETSDGSIWFGGRGVVRLHDGETTYIRRSDGLPGDLVYSLAEGPEGAIWVGLWGGGVCRLRSGTPPCESVPLDRSPDRDPLAGAVVRAIHTDSDGTVWLGSERGLFSYRDGAFHAHDVAPDAEIQAIREGPEGRLWIGTAGAGLAYGRPGEFRRLTRREGLSGDVVRDILVSGDHVIVATEGRGLSVLTDEAPDGSFDVATVRQDDGLYDDGIHRILEDGSGRLWMTTNRGVFWVDGDELRTFAEGGEGRIHSMVYTEAHGLPSREANGGAQPAGTVSSDGRIWVPTVDGLAVLRPSEVEAAPPPPVFVETLAFGDSVARNPGEISLPRGVRDFELSYTAPEGRSPEHLRFRYRLEGFSDDWVEADRRTAVFTNVPPGRHRFAVSVAHAGGSWGEATVLPLHVPHRFYETSWFLATALAGLLVLCSGVYRVRVRASDVRASVLEREVAARTNDLTAEKEASERARVVAEAAREEAEAAQRTIAEQAERLRSLDRARARFFANVSHEFRTPLTLTIGPLEDLVQERAGELDRGVRDELVVALRNARRLLRLVNQLLDAARLEAGELQPTFQATDLRVLLEGLVGAFAPAAERKGIAFTFVSSTESAELSADPELLEKVFINLLSNALKFTPDGGSVKLELARDERDGEVVYLVSVRDNGPGIPASELDRVFDRFHRVDVGSKPLPGTGIGLSLVKELVALHEGAIRVGSDVGFGSTFVVELPYRTPEALGRPPSLGESGDLEGAVSTLLADGDLATRASVNETGSPEHPRVLVVDDNAEVRRYLIGHLREWFRVLEAAGGDEALRLVRERDVDLVVSDVVMPGIDGIELCRAIKNDPELVLLPVILLTARAEVEDRLAGLAEGADDYVTKPFDANELTMRCRNLVTRAARIAERRVQVLEIGEIDVESVDARFIRRLRDAIESSLHQSDFGVDELASAVGHSRSSLYRHLDRLGLESPAMLIRSARLQRAAQLIQAGAGNVASVAFRSGFSSVSHFSRCFKERFGVPPSVYEGDPVRE